MGGTSTISGGKLCLRIDPRVPTLSGCAASRGPTIKANTVPFSWIMASIHEGLVKDWQRTQLAGYISKSRQIMRLSCSERRLAPLDSWIGQSGPAAVGGGTPLFPTLDKWITLELVENRTFPSGAVLLRYVAKN
jgi:hypothetical protein